MGEGHNELQSLQNLWGLMKSNIHISGFTTVSIILRLLIPHHNIFVLLFLCFCNLFQKDYYDHCSALLLAVWDGRYYKSIHNKIFNESSKIVLLEELEASLCHSLLTSLVLSQRCQTGK